MDRRAFIGAMTGGLLVAPLAAEAQRPPNRPLVAYLAGGTRWNAARFVGFFQEGLRELGYIDGHTIDIVARFADGYVERLSALAQDLVQLRPAVIVAGLSTRPSQPGT